MSDDPRTIQATPSGGPSSRWLTVPLEGFAACVLLAMAIMTCIDVIGREVFNAPLNGATELTQVMMPLIIFAVLPAVSYREDHITVDLLDLWYPDAGINVRQLVLNTIIALAMAGVAYQLWILGGELTELNDLTQYLQIPKGPIAYFISVMSAATSIMLFANAARYVRGRGPMSPGAEAADAHHKPLDIT